MIKKLKRIPKFFKEVREELKKVNWSTRQELVGAAIIVFVVTAILTTYIFLVDSALALAVKSFLK